MGRSTRSFVQAGSGWIDVGFDNATETQDGFMSAADKTTLDDLASGAPAIPNTVVTLANGVNKNLFAVDFSLIPDRSFACMVFIAVEAQNATDTQIRSGNVIANVARASNGTYATTAADRTSNANTAGALTVTFDWTTSGNTATFLVNASSNLAGVTEMHINFYVPYASHVGVISLV